MQKSNNKTKCIKHFNHIGKYLRSSISFRNSISKFIKDIFTKHLYENKKHYNIDSELFL